MLSCMMRLLGLSDIHLSFVIITHHSPTSISGVSMAVETSTLGPVFYYVLAVSRLTADGDIELISNVTSVAGREVILPCTVSGQGDTVCLKLNLLLSHV